MTDIVETLQHISNATSKKLIEASINNNLNMIEKLVTAGADPYIVFGKKLEKSPSPFREWYNNYLNRWEKYIKSSKTDKDKLVFIANFLRLDKINNLQNKSKTELKNMLLHFIDQHSKLPIWFQNINEENYTPDEFDKTFPKNQNPFKMCYNDVILDKKEQGYDTAGIATPELTGKPPNGRPIPQKNWRDFSIYEIALAFRNHGFPMEVLELPITPLGLHYLLIHFDIPVHLHAKGYSITIGGQVKKPYKVTLEEIMNGPIVEQVVTMQCAGVGRGLVNPRPIYVPWSKECVGTYKWTGTPLRYFLEKAELNDNVVDIVFTGHDVGIDLGSEHSYEKSIPLEEAMKDEVILAWAHNDVPLLPQHGAPLRMIIPSYYGSNSVKWLRAITAVNKAFEGIEQNTVYVERRSRSGKDKGIHFTKKDVDSLILPPGIPDLLTRHRFLKPGKTTLKGVAWSGYDTIKRVEVSVDGLKTWKNAKLIRKFQDKYAWVHWEYEWNPVEEGEYVIACRAYDMAGNVQLINPQCDWNRTGMGVSSVQRLLITVKKEIGDSGNYIPCYPRIVVDGASVPEPPEEIELASLRTKLTDINVFTSRKNKK